MKYPIGIQDFGKIRNDGYVYLDKTDLIYDLVHNGNIYFLSRPRRFGKSLLISTLECYFQGKKELFKGLAIEQLEKEWKQYPVFHIDFNGKDFTQAGELEKTLQTFVETQELNYGRNLLTTKKDEEDIFHFNSSGQFPNELSSMVFATKLPWLWTLRNSLQR